MSSYIIWFSMVIFLFQMISGVSIENNNKLFYQGESNTLTENNTDIDLYFDSMNASSFIALHNIDNNNSDDDINNITASIEFGSFQLENYTFKVIKENKTAFKIGFGIRTDYSNDLMQILKQNNYIDKQIVYYSSYPKPSINFIINKSKNDQANFTYCSLTERKDLEAKYHNSWVCDYSHIKPPKANLINETIEINGRAVLNSNSQFIIAPIQYIKTIKDYFKLESKCDLFTDEDYGEVDFHCNMTKADIDSMDEIAFIFDGIAYAIPAISLFNETIDEETNTTYYSSLIIFRKQKHNVWSFGDPLLKHYQIELDFDNKEIGLKGYKAYDMSDGWIEWKDNKRSFINRVYNDKRMMIIGIFLGSAILIFVFVIIVRAFKKRSGGGEMSHSVLKEEEIPKPNE